MATADATFNNGYSAKVSDHYYCACPTSAVTVITDGCD